MVLCSAASTANSLQLGGCSIYPCIPCGLTNRMLLCCPVLPCSLPVSAAHHGAWLSSQHQKPCRCADHLLLLINLLSTCSATTVLSVLGSLIRSCHCCHVLLCCSPSWCSAQHTTCFCLSMLMLGTPSTVTCLLMRCPAMHCSHHSARLSSQLCTITFQLGSCTVCLVSPTYPVNSPNIGCCVCLALPCLAAAYHGARLSSQHSRPALVWLCLPPGLAL
jgi:hypothetical protein